MIRTRCIWIGFFLLSMVSCRGSLPYAPILNDIPPLTVIPPSNVILFIGDGMGDEHILAGGMWRDGTGGDLLFESFPVSIGMGTLNRYGMITDSAASATAMATGTKVANRVLSLDIPGTETNLETLAEAARKAGSAIGLVTTSYMTDATPAAFIVHCPDRSDPDIAADMLAFFPELMFGGGSDIQADDAAAAGYITVTDSAGLESLTSTSTGPVFGRFGEGAMPYVVDGRGSLPSLDSMVEKALDRLEEYPEGFFLLVENELIDEASHSNDIGRLVAEIDALDQAVGTAVSWAEDRIASGIPEDTLIIVTADHETGGLDVLSSGGSGTPPTISWSGTGHTGRRVRLFASGIGAEEYRLVMENQDIYRIMIRYYR